MEAAKEQGREPGEIVSEVLESHWRRLDRAFTETILRATLNGRTENVATVLHNADLEAKGNHRAVLEASYSPACLSMGYRHFGSWGKFRDAIIRRGLD